MDRFGGWRRDARTNDVAEAPFGFYFGTMRETCIITYAYIGTVRAHAFSVVRTMVCDVVLYIIYVVIIFKSV